MRSGNWECVDRQQQQQKSEGKVEVVNTIQTYLVESLRCRSMEHPYPRARTLIRGIVEQGIIVTVVITLLYPYRRDRSESVNIALVVILTVLEVVGRRLTTCYVCRIRLWCDIVFVQGSFFVSHTDTDIVMRRKGVRGDGRDVRGGCVKYGVVSSLRIPRRLVQILRASVRRICGKVCIGIIIWWYCGGIYGQLDRYCGYLHLIIFIPRHYRCVRVVVSGLTGESVVIAHITLVVHSRVPQRTLR